MPGLTNRILLQGASRTEDAQSSVVPAEGAAGVHVIVDVTDIQGGTPQITPKIVGFDPASGKSYDLLVGAAIDSVGTNVIKIGRGIAGLAQASAQDGLPEQWSVVVTHADAQPITYSVGYQFLR